MIESPFAHIPESRTPPKPKARLPIDELYAKPRAPRKKPQRREHSFQKILVKILRRAIAPEGTASPDGVMFFCVDHAARVSLQYGSARKARGVVKGIPDLHLHYAGRAFCIELKEGRGKTDAEQDAFASAADACGVQCGVAHTLQEVFALLQAWQIPHHSPTP